jgi:hypothetical protein
MARSDVIAGSEGFGHHRRIHSAHFFELADQPQEIQIATSEADTERLFARLKTEGVQSSTSGRRSSSASSVGRRSRDRNPGPGVALAGSGAT